MLMAHSALATMQLEDRSVRLSSIQSRPPKRIEIIPESEAKLEALSCSHCGAPIQVPEGTQFVTCAHCGSRLVVKRNETASYTEVLGHLESTRARISKDMELVRLESELERIDREWQMEREQYL